MFNNIEMYLQSLREELYNDYGLVLHDDKFNLEVSHICYVYEDLLTACAELDRTYINQWFNLYNLTIRGIPAKMLDNEFDVLEIVRQLNIARSKNVG